MTTRQPEALRLAEILECGYSLAWLYERGGYEVSAELRTQHARITELESQLEAIGAGGVQALSAAPAVTSEQRRLIGVIADKIEDGTLFQSGIYPKKDLARFVRNMLDTTPTAPAASPTPSAEQQAAHKAAPAQQAGEAADSVPAVSDLPPLPEPDLRDVGTKPQEIKEFLKGYATEYARTAIAASAPADSVQEDAARYRHLRDCNSGSLAVMQITGTNEDDWFILTEDDADAVIDAARKQGTNHD